MKSKRDSFVLYTSYIQQVDLLPDEQAGILFKAILRYAEDSVDPEGLDSATSMAFSFIKAKMDRDTEKYEEKCEKRREAGLLGGRPKANGLSEKQKNQKVISESKRKQKNPDGDSECDNDLKESTLKGTKEKFTPPTVEEVKQYAAESGYTVDAERFVDYYQENGWMAGKNHMKDWKAAVRNWSRNDKERQGKTTKPKKTTDFQQRDYDFTELNRQLFTRGMTKEG